MKNFYKKGFTIVEMLIVIVIIGILVAIVLPSFSAMRQNQALKNTVSDVVSSLDKARSQTLASLNSSEYGVHFQSNKIVIFKGTSYSANDANNTSINVTSPATLSSISLTGGASDIYFARLSGTPNVTGTIVVSVSSNQSLTKTITISATGIASLN
ncbi:MAG: prepilin-type N-terminal cleavage/methylation domain-containing protein [bacterium]